MAQMDAVELNFNRALVGAAARPVVSSRWNAQRRLTHPTAWMVRQRGQTVGKIESQQPLDSPYASRAEIQSMIRQSIQRLSGSGPRREIKPRCPPASVI